MFFDFKYKTPLKSNLHGRYIEHLSLLMLRRSFDGYSDFDVSDKPDLVSVDGKCGIEVTEAIVPEIAHIKGEFTKLKFGKKDDNEKNKCIDKIKLSGGKIDDLGVSFPAVNSNDEWNAILNVLSKKLKLLPTYKSKGFVKMGLFIMFNEPPIPFNVSDSLLKLSDFQKDFEEKYDCLFLGYHYGVICYDFKAMSCTVNVIEEKHFQEMSVSARDIVESKY